MCPTLGGHITKKTRYHITQLNTSKDSYRDVLSHSAGNLLITSSTCTTRTRIFVLHHTFDEGESTKCNPPPLHPGKKCNTTDTVQNQCRPFARRFRSRSRFLLAEETYVAQKTFGGSCLIRPELLSISGPRSTTSVSAAKSGRDYICLRSSFSLLPSDAWGAKTRLAAAQNTFAPSSAFLPVCPAAAQTLSTAMPLWSHDYFSLALLDLALYGITRAEIGDSGTKLRLEYLGSSFSNFLVGAAILVLSAERSQWAIATMRKSDFLRTRR